MREAAAVQSNQAARSGYFQGGEKGGAGVGARGTRSDRCFGCGVRPRYNSRSIVAHCGARRTVALEARTPRARQKIKKSPRSPRAGSTGRKRAQRPLFQVSFTTIAKLRSSRSCSCATAPQRAQSGTACPCTLPGCLTTVARGGAHSQTPAAPALILQLPTFKCMYCGLALPAQLCEGRSAMPLSAQRCSLFTRRSAAAPSTLFTRATLPRVQLFRARNTTTRATQPRVQYCQMQRA